MDSAVKTAGNFMGMSMYGAVNIFACYVKVGKCKILDLMSLYF
jgi:hypothetical protein